MTPSEHNTDLLSSRRSVREFTAVLLRNWRLIGASTVLAGVIAATYVTFADRYYRAVTTLLPVERQGTGNTLASIANQLGGLAAVSGLSIGDSDHTEAIEVLKSRSLVRKFIEREGLLPVVFTEYWSVEERAWTVSDTPSVADGEGRFRSEILRISEDLSSGLISVAVTWTDPKQAADWANGLAQLANEELRAKAIGRARANLDYLQREVDAVTVLEVRQSIYDLMRAQIETMMVANVGDEFAFRVVDPATQPEAPVRPRVVILLAVATVFGLFIGVVLSFVIELVRAD
jgi:uncharacterized protein involved in exopolysaccharide biosynthesis